MGEIRAKVRLENYEDQVRCKLGQITKEGIRFSEVDFVVDTGAVVHQAPFHPGKGDNFSTYFYLQADVLKDLATRAVEDVLGGSLKTLSLDMPSQQYYHPTLWGYLWTGMTRGVW